MAVNSRCSGGKARAASYSGAAGGREDAIPFRFRHGEKLPGGEMLYR